MQKRKISMQMYLFSQPHSMEKTHVLVGVRQINTRERLDEKAIHNIFHYLGANYLSPTVMCRTTQSYLHPRLISAEWSLHV